MSDSVDRVFSHALNTVNKIRIGSEKPPSSIRLKLYGLYKQSMEGDVDGIMDRPEGDTEEAHRAREKWDAWKQQNGLSRTEAKRRYIETLIETMHKYASPSPDARELVAELEFVWDQVKSNVPSSSSSSPLQTLGIPSYHTLDSSGTTSHDHPPPPNQHLHGRRSGQMTVLPPPPPGDEDDEEVFVDAQDSQDNSEHADGARDAAPAATAAARGAGGQRNSSSVVGDRKWRRRVEATLVMMTTEVAALREQLESRHLFARSQRRSFGAWIGWFSWFVVKLIAADIVILGIILLWMRRKKDRRLEGAIRVLLGDAVVQMQRVGGQQMVQSLGRVGLSKLTGRKSLTQ